MVCWGGAIEREREPQAGSTAKASLYYCRKWGWRGERLVCNESQQGRQEPVRAERVAACLPIPVPGSLRTSTHSAIILSCPYTSLINTPF